VLEVREPNGWDLLGEGYCCINWNAVIGPVRDWNDVLVAGTTDYYNGSNYGPHAAIIETYQSPA
jgi:hypothetical protein